MAEKVLFDSHVSKFEIDDIIPQSRDISPYIVAIDGLPGPRELAPIFSPISFVIRWICGMSILRTRR